VPRSTARSVNAALASARLSCYRIRYALWYHIPVHIIPATRVFLYTSADASPPVSKQLIPTPVDDDDDDATANDDDKEASDGSKDLSIVKRDGPVDGHCFNRPVSQFPEPSRGVLLTGGLYIVPYISF